VLGSYVKDEQSDINSIVTGMVGFKGHVHVAFGNELVLGETDDDAKIAALIDSQVINNYRLHATNLLALEQLRRESSDQLPELGDCFPAIAKGAIGDGDVAQRFDARLAALDENIRPFVLRMYANPVISRCTEMARESLVEPKIAAVSDI
jgi:hypothetical protein